MNGLIINISWEWALGIIGVLVVIAWKGSARFAAIETSIEWMKGLILDLKVNSDNKASGKPAFEAKSPLNLTTLGQAWLNDSGLKDYIDSNPAKFKNTCDSQKEANPYELQKHIFKLFEGNIFDPTFEDRLKKFAFEKGTTTDVLRRVGAIYLRNICMENFGMNKDDIDKHDPEKIS